MKSFLRGFVYAFSGIRYGLQRERNLRVHMAVILFVLYFSAFYRLTTRDYAILFLTFGLVTVSELINTAFERTIDLVSPAYHDLAKIVKDIAAGAVLLSSITAASVGVCLFWDVTVFKAILTHLTASFMNASLFIAMVALALLFVFGFKET